MRTSRENKRQYKGTERKKRRSENEESKDYDQNIIRIRNERDRKPADDDK